jgi:hypothetical protein
VSTCVQRCVVISASLPDRGYKNQRQVNRMLDLFLILAALTGLPALTAAGRLLMGLLARLIGLAFVMALVMIVLLELATHGKVL